MLSAQCNDVGRPRSRPADVARQQAGAGLYPVQTFTHEDSEFELDPLSDLPPVKLTQEQNDAVELDEEKPAERPRSPPTAAA